MKKYIILSILCFCVSLFVYSQEAIQTQSEQTNEIVAEETASTMSSTQEEDTNTSSEIKSLKEERLETLMFGLDGEVINLINTLIGEEDNSYTKELSELFETARNAALKDKIIAYFSHFGDPSLKEYALYLLEDPFDEKNSTVNAVIQYVGDLEIAEASSLLVDLIDYEEEAYFSAAITALGKIGGTEDALFLVEYLENDLPIAQRQNVVRALASLEEVQTYDALVDMVENEDENSYVRMYAAEAIGKINPTESLDILTDLYNSTDPNLREYAIKGVSANSSPEAEKLIAIALRDDHYKVRLQAIDSIKEKNITSAAPALLYRTKNDSESAIKIKGYDVMAYLNYSDGIDYMIDLLEDERVEDTVKAHVSSSLLKYNISKGVDAVIILALKTVNDDKKKNLRYALGKEFAKHENAKFESVCSAYLASKDVATQGTGLDIYRRNPYLSLRGQVQSLTDGAVANSIKAKAKSILEG